MGAFKRKQLFGAFTTESYRVISTDYTDYAVVYSCSLDKSVETMLDMWQDQI